MKTAISIPDNTFALAEAMAAELKLSRSELFTRAMQEYLQNHRYRDVTARLNTVYQNETDALDADLFAMQKSTIDREPW